MGVVFRLLNARGVSTRIAAAVDITQGRLYDYMNGKSRVEKLALFEQIADAFHLPGHLLGLARRAWEPAAAEPTKHEPELPPDGDDLAAMDAFRSADRQTGGGRLYGAVVRHLADRVAPRLVDTGSGSQVFAVAAALTEMAGWMAHDSGQDDLAARHFSRALPLARTSGDYRLPRTSPRAIATSPFRRVTQRVPPAGLRPGSTSPAVVREFPRSLHGSKRCRPELWPQGHRARQQCALSKRPTTRSMDRRMPLIPG